MLRGVPALAYLYAGNNPISWFDSTGLDVQNNSNDGVWISGEHGEQYYLAPGDTFYGNQDGVYSGHKGVYKANNGVSIVINPDGSINTFDGPDLSRFVQGFGENSVGPHLLPFGLRERTGGPKDDDFSVRNKWADNPNVNSPSGSMCGGGK
ncbi:hypothetical protein [Corallococcus sp. CA041A]|uniref:hypothetical protein n=1 Tax=Corallococcus sp. CA041A TaxID=2316727 RepID=UPI0011C4067B|nr:hypothetical protein [Corallococcus sp. CA041A]